MLEIERVHHQRRRQSNTIPDPEGGNVEISQQPLIRVRVERICILDAFEQWLQLGTDERIARIRCVDVQPDTWEPLKRLANLLECVKRTTASGPESGGDEERHQALQLILFHGLCMSWVVDV